MHIRVDTQYYLLFKEIIISYETLEMIISLQLIFAQYFKVYKRNFISILTDIFTLSDWKRPLKKSMITK